MISFCWQSDISSIMTGGYNRPSLDAWTEEKNKNWIFCLLPCLQYPYQSTACCCIHAYLDIINFFQTRLHVTTYKNLHVVHLATGFSSHAVMQGSCIHNNIVFIRQLWCDPIQKKLIMFMILVTEAWKKSYPFLE